MVKIEKPQAVQNLEAIVAATDGVMVARGDLGVEMDVQRVPAIQKRVIALCNQAHRPVITATQMLNSMEHSSRPTRAEASDVFNAVLDGTDAVMLSGETAVGEYPVEAVATMRQICAEAEAYLKSGARPARGESASLAGFVEPITEATVDAACLVADRLDAPLIVVATDSGRTALALSNRRPAATILAVTRTEQVARTARRVLGGDAGGPARGDVGGTGAGLRDRLGQVAPDRPAGPARGAPPRAGARPGPKPGRAGPRGELKPAGRSTMNATQLWQRYQHYLCRVPSLGLTLDVSRMGFEDGFLDAHEPALAAAFAGMEALEKGAIANPDENRMVGHYWLRNPGPGPDPGDRRRDPQDHRRRQGVRRRRPRRPDPAAHRGPVHAACCASGSAAPPSGRCSWPTPWATRPPTGCGSTSSTTPTRTGSPAPSGAWRAGSPRRCASSPRRAAGRRRPATACSWSPTPTRRPGSTSPGTPSRSPCPARGWTRPPTAEGWLARFPMYDWVGGRTSELSAVGLLPAALQGLDIDGLLAGAAACDEATRGRDLKTNPAALMALMWHHATGGKGQKDMVVLPYKDRLLLFSRYLQQLVMESIGKQLDLKGNRVEQGLTVYGNKGSTDQHAYVQQLREGVPNFFAVFVRVLEDGGSAREVEPGATAGDYLHGFLLGTRAALFENGRESMTITVPRVDARTVGALIALFERAVGLYAGSGRGQRLPPAGGRGREEGGRGACWPCRRRCSRPCPTRRRRPSRSPPRPVPRRRSSRSS